MRLFGVPWLFVTLCNAQQYFLQSSFSGPTFFDNFDFWTTGDPTYGYVHYVEQAVAEQYGMINTTASNTTVWGVDTTEYLDPGANLGRLSIRLTSIQSWTHGLVILDLVHMPANQCGVWPAFWTLGSGVWPENGEIDIIEYTNTVPNNLMALHTSASPNCTIAGSSQTGNLLTHDCAAGGGYTGCGISATTPDNIGYEFDTAAGGVYAMEWTSTAIQIWFFPRSQIPASILEANDTVGPDPSTFGLPVANFQGSCDIDAHFFNHSLVFDTTFCGSYAGNLWASAGCPLIDPGNPWQSCNDFVAANPQAFTDTYWEVNYLNVYQTAAGAVATSSSSLSSVVPAASTSPVHSLSGNAEGRPTTPTMQFPVSLTSSTSSSSSVTGSVTSSGFVAPPPSSTSLATSASISLPSTSSTFATATFSASSSASSSTSSSFITSSTSSVSAGACIDDECSTEVIVIVQTVTIPALMQGLQGAPSPQIGLARQEPMSMEDRNYRKPRQVVEGTTTYWPEPLPPAYASTSTSTHKRSAVEPLGLPYDVRPSMCNSADCAVVNDMTALFHRETQQPVPDRYVDALFTAPADQRIFPVGFRPAPLELPNSESPRAAMLPSLPSATSEAEKNINARQILPGGSIGFCSVPGSSCNEHHKRDEVEERQILPGGSIGFCSVPGSSCNEHHKRDDIEERQILPGGSIGFCSVPGSSCNEHHKLDEDTNVEWTISSLLHEEPAHTEITAETLLLPTPTQAPYAIESPPLGPPPVIPFEGAGGIMMEPDDKRDTDSGDESVERRDIRDSSVVYITVVETFTVPAYTPTTFSFDPLTKRDGGILAPTSAVEPTEVYQESSITSTPAEFRVPHTCTPIVLLEQGGVPTYVGCLGPQHTSLPHWTTSLEVAKVTSTITATRGIGSPKLASPGSLLNDYMDEAVVNKAVSTPVWTCMTVVVVSCVAAALAWWSSGI